MKKIIRLTEDDLTRIVKRVINESNKQPTKAEILDMSEDELENLGNIKGEYLGKKGEFFNFKKKGIMGVICGFRTDDKTPDGLRKSYRSVKVKDNEVKFNQKKTSVNESDKEKVSRKITHNTPNWSFKLMDLSRKKQIELIENYKQHIVHLLPNIIKYFKYKFKNYSVNIEIGSRKVYNHNDNYSIERILIKFNFDDDSLMSFGGTDYEVKKEIYKDLESVFNIDPSKHGTPLIIEVYVDGI